MIEKRKRRGDESRRARLYLEQLSWLDGYATETGWWHLDSDRQVVLDGVVISKARRAAQTLLREHRPELRKQVGDVDRWWDIVDSKLAWCSAAAAGKQPRAYDPAPFLTPRLGRMLVERHAGRLGPAANELATARMRDLARVERGLEWLAAHEAELVGLGDRPHIQEVGISRLAHALVRLELDGAGGNAAVVRRDGVRALLGLLAIDAPDPQPALDLTRSLESRLLRHRDKHTPQLQHSGRRVVQWILALAVRDAATRQRALALIGAGGIADAIAPWQTWEREHEGLFARAGELAGRDFEKDDRAVHVGRIVNKLVRARDTAPAHVALSDLVLEVDMLATERFARFHPAIVKLLGALPASLPAHARARTLLQVARNAATADDDAHLEWLWDALADALVRGAPPAMLRPWSLDHAHRGGWSCIDGDLVEGFAKRARVNQLVELLARHAVTEGPTDFDARNIATWLQAGLADSLVLDVVKEMGGAITTIKTDVARAAVALADGSVADTVLVARALHDMTEELPWATARHVASFAGHAARSGAGWLVRGALLANQRARLADIADLVMALPVARRPTLLEPKDTAWIGRYPAVLGGALHHLAMVDPDAERTAAKRLAPDLRDPAELRQEIAALRAREATPSTAKRLANLERQLAEPKVPSKQRLANLSARVEATAVELGMGRWIRDATRVASEQFIRAFGLSAWPEWAESDDRSRAAQLRELLFGLLGLEASDRALAGRLLRGRSGPPPWDLRDEPANRRFLDRMRAAGIDPTPWLDPSPRVVRAGHGPLSLALCADPLEVFAMGAHFDTCLAPNGGNFFSVVANAADINKRVLYARRDGRVVGRCLFAITDSLTLIVFHAYCHERIDFASIVRDYAVELAARMGAMLATRGSVRTLLARDWYDDGARDFVGRFAGLDDTFDLAAISPDELVPRLREVLGRDLDDVTLPIVLGLRALEHQPRHLAPLVPFVLASNVSLIRSEAARLALGNNDLELADRLLGDHDHAIRLEEWGWPNGELVARLRPSRALARLRRSRSRSVRRWSDERGDRIALAAIALQALERPRQAAAMFRLAAKTESWLAEDMRARLGAMGAPIDGEVAS